LPSKLFMNYDEELAKQYDTVVVYLSKDCVSFKGVTHAEIMAYRPKDVELFLKEQETLLQEEKIIPLKQQETLLQEEKIMPLKHRTRLVNVQPTPPLSSKEQETLLQEEKIIPLKHRTRLVNVKATPPLSSKRIYDNIYNEPFDINVAPHTGNLFSNNLTYDQAPTLNETQPVQPSDSIGSDGAQSAISSSTVEAPLLPSVLSGASASHPAPNETRGHVQDSSTRSERQQTSFANEVTHSFRGEQTRRTLNAAVNIYYYNYKFTSIIFFVCPMTPYCQVFGNYLHIFVLPGNGIQRLFILLLDVTHVQTICRSNVSFKLTMYNKTREREIKCIFLSFSSPKNVEKV